MRRPPVLLLAAACLPLLLVSACAKSNTGSTPTGSSSGSSTSTGAPWSGDFPTVTGDFNTAFTVTLPSTAPPSDLQVKVLQKGTGPTVTKGDLIVANYVGKIWGSGKEFDASFNHGGPVGFAIGVGQVVPGWDQGLVGQTVGSRVALILPPSAGYGSQGQPQAGIQGTDTLAFVVDILGAYHPTASASGKATPPGDDGVPGVTVNPGRPTIKIPPGAPPNKLIVYPVITGSGPKVQAGDTVVMQYVASLWRTGKPFDASWDHNVPITLNLGSLSIKGFQGLVGQTVGSRVVLVIPPSQGFGPQGQSQAGVKGTDTMVFAVDILAAYPATKG